MKLIIGILFFSLMSSKAMALSVEVKHSEASSYLHFLFSGLKEPFTSRTMQELAEKVAGKAFRSKKLKIDVEVFQSFLRHGYNFDDEVQNRPEGFWAEDAFLILAVNSDSMEDFEKQLSILMPYRGISAYYRVKKVIYPIFKKTVWDVSLKNHPQQIAETLKFMETSQFSDWLKKAKAFYGSEYPEEVSFKVGLIPIPDKGLKSGHTLATNLRDIQIVPYLESRGLKRNLDVIFHEFCHALYEGQSKDKMKEIDQFYLTSTHSHALFVYRYLNEALATAWGNGWYREKLDGKLNPRSWYSVDYVDKLGRAFLPLIKKYVGDGRAMDKAFYRETLNIAKKTFPNGPKEIGPQFMAVQLLIDHKVGSSRPFKSVLKRNFRIQSWNAMAPIRDRDIEETKANPLKTAIVISSDWKNAESTISKLYQGNKILSKESKDQEFWAIYPRDSGYLFWINTQDKKSFEKLMRAFKKLKSLPNNPKLIKL